MLKNFLHLSLASQITYVLLAVAVVVNAYMAFSPRMKAHWRICFSWTAIVLGLYVLYIGLRLGGVLDPKDYAVLVQWLFPLLIFPLMVPALLLHWESKFYKRALEKQQDL